MKDVENSIFGFQDALNGRRSEYEKRLEFAQME